MRVYVCVFARKCVCVFLCICGCVITYPNKTTKIANCYELISQVGSCESRYNYVCFIHNLCVIIFLYVCAHMPSFLTLWEHTCIKEATLPLP